MKTRKVSIDTLEAPAKPKAPSARELRRMELEGKLEQAIGSAKSDTRSAVKLILEQGEKLPAIRTAFNRVRERVHAAEVSLHKRGDDLYIAGLANTRGRRRKGS